MNKAIVIIISLIWCCSCSPAHHTHSFTDYLTQNVYNFRALKKDSGVIDMDHFNGLQWDHFYILTAYTSPKSLIGDLAAHKELVNATGIYGGHQLELIAFFYGNTYTGYDDIRNFSFLATGLMTMPIPHRFNRGRTKFMYKYLKFNDYYMIPMQRPVHVYPNLKDWIEPLKSGVYDTSKLVK